MRSLMRSAIAMAVLSGAAISAHAQVAVVKVINFTCQYCRASETMDEPIRRAVAAAGGKMVYAALPSDDGSEGARERVYYAARALYPAEEPAVRQALYKGAQDLGYPLATALQTTEWLNTELPSMRADWHRVAAASDTAEGRDPYQRAIRLALSAGVQVLPSYVIVSDGRVVRTLDVDSVGGTYPALREGVLQALEKVTQSTASKN